LAINVKNLEINMSFVFADLFAGIGGFRTALESVDGKCVFSSEWDKYAQATYKTLVIYQMEILLRYIHL
jgi:DNA (cytosine-5)-methyltransferase 1